jgi:hypothetical protein
MANGRQEHPTVRAARRKWPKAIWIIGSGEYASVSLCRPGTTVMLFETQAEADTAKDFINETGCGGGCRGDHVVIKIPPR